VLLQFTLKNHYSFHDETTLEMIATKNTEHAYSLISRENVSILPVAAIYGANGAGKSNFINSFANVIDFMLKSIDYGKDSDEPDTPFVPFVFTDEVLKEPIEAELVFLVEEIEYRYGFVIKNELVEEEYLDCKPKGKKGYVRIFLREKAKKNIVVGTSSAVTEWERNILKVVGPVIEESDLVLTFLCRRQGDDEPHRYRAINEWLRNICVSNNTSAHIGNLRITNSSNLKKLYEDADEQKEHMDFVKTVDPTIQALSLREKKDTEGRTYFEVYAKHRLIDSERLIEVPVGVESEGTKAAIKLYPSLRNVLAFGGILVADELDRSLHPLLLLHVIQMFTNPEINRHGAQLICTLHNALVMDKKNLRRDEIWFAEKNYRGESELYSLADVIVNDKKVRSDGDYCKQYILGTFGAIPEFTNI